METFRKSVPGRISGTHNLTTGASSGTVTASLGEVPDRVVLSVEAPDGGVHLFAVLGETRADGFDFELSGDAPATGYKLHYLCDF